MELKFDFKHPFYLVIFFLVFLPGIVLAIISLIPLFEYLDDFIPQNNPFFFILPLTFIILTVVAIFAVGFAIIFLLSVLDKFLGLDEKFEKTFSATKQITFPGYSIFVFLTLFFISFFAIISTELSTDQLWLLIIPFVFLALAIAAGYLSTLKVEFANQDLVKKLAKEYNLEYKKVQSQYFTDAYTASGNIEDDLLLSFGVYLEMQDESSTFVNFASVGGRFDLGEGMVTVRRRSFIDFFGKLLGKMPPIDIPSQEFNKNFVIKFYDIRPNIAGKIQETFDFDVIQYLLSLKKINELVIVPREISIESIVNLSEPEFRKAIELVLKFAKTLKV